MNNKFHFPTQSNLTQAKLRWIIGLTLTLCAAILLLTLSPVITRAATPTPEPIVTTGYDYTVQTGDNWSTVAILTGLPIAQLKAANPQAIRRNGWLLQGEKLHIPSGTSPQTSVYIVQRGEGWGIIAERFGITIGRLQAANPRSIRPNLVLYRGERLLILGKGTAATANQTATPAATVSITETTKPTTTVKVTSTVAITPEAKQTVSALTTAQANTKATAEAQTKVDAQATVDSKATAAAKATADANATATNEAAATNAAKTTADALAVQVTVDAKATAEAEIAAKTAADAATAAAQATTVAAAQTATTVATPIATSAPVSTTIVTTTTVSTTTTQNVTNTENLTGTQSVTSTAASTVTAACPAEFTAYPDALLGVVNSSKGGADGLRAFLQVCGALDENAFTVKDVNGDGVDDILVIYKNPRSTAATPETDLIILDGGKAGGGKVSFTIGHRAKAAGEVHLLATEDLNDDKKPDVAWSVTTCGASTCFDTTEIYSWTGSEWQSWTKDPITMAYAQINLEEANKAGAGKEIVIKGGIYGSVGAGPQRGRTEIWGSVSGAPYTLLSKTYDASNCLYHVVLDANEAFLKGASDKFVASETLYTKAATDQSLTKCWVRDNELTELRSFSLFRLALVAANQGKAGVATDLISSLTATYKNTIYDKVGQVWLTNYAKGNDISRACAATNEFAKNNQEATDVLADYGYANPSFTAADVCPVVAVEGATAQPNSASRVGVTNTITSTTTTVSATQVITASQAPSQTSTAANSTAVNSTTVNSTTTTTQTTVVTSTTAITAGGQTAKNSLAACPKDLGGYPSALTTVLKAAAGDAAVIEKWMRGCGALDDKRGAIKMVDLNGDKLPDVVLLPTLVSDKGFGPNGTQGTVLIYYAEKDGAYQLVSKPAIYGKPALLSTEDLNADGKMDIAWTVEGCSTFCVLETQIVSWDGKSYTSTIEPGAVVAVGTAKFEPVAAGDLGQGQQLVLQGGISGTPEGGLAVPHTEIWQSIKDGLFQRIGWRYDRKVEGNDCLGLRLVEADVALEAASVLGYKPAIDLYSQSLDPKLKACSIFGMAADQELVLLQGLSSFRLLQAQTFSGDVEAAKVTLANLTKGQPDSHYTAAAKQWSDEYAKAKDATAACKAVQTLFDQNEEMWKITDHFGYNHPALAAEQVCYKP